MAFAVLPFIAGSGLVYFGMENRQLIEGFSLQHWILLFLLLAIPIAMSLIPNTLAGLMAGYFLGWAGLAGMILSFSTACLLGFSFGKLSGKGFIEDVCQLWPSLKDLLTRFQKRPFSLVFSLRLMPAPPFAVGSLLLSWLDVPLRAVFWGSLAGMFPRMFLVVWLGQLASDISRLAGGSMTDSRLVVSLTFFAGLGLLIFYLRFLRKSA